MDLSTLVTILGIAELLLSSIIIPFIISVSKIAKGTRCQLRSEMLRIYYKHCESEEIHQYEYENFVMLYEAYKKLGGNSFIDKIYKEVQTWEIIPLKG